MHTLLLLLLSAAPQTEPPHILPDAPSAAYRPLLSAAAENDGLDPVLRAGERNLAWLDHINSFREQKLSFTSKETQRGYPIDAPSEYNPAIILGDFSALQNALPKEIESVIFSQAPFPNTPPIDEKDYVHWGHLLDRSYQIAARWRTMRGWLPILESRRSQDVRGYYFLSRLESREEKLRNFSSLPQEQQTQIREWLVSLCLNGSDSFSTCSKRVDQLISSKADLNAYYEAREPRSSQLYRSFFTIPDFAKREDFRWAEGKLIAPFTDPIKEDVRHFMQFNVEEEWRWGDWKLELPFTQEEGHPYVVFRPGATPNVNGLGGDRITMNANQPLTEYDAQWTIRHEFGHVLGLPDCYVEFYAVEKEAIITYQIDVENIMCSRRGHVKQENVSELARVYGN